MAFVTNMRYDKVTKILTLLLLLTLLLSLSMPTDAIVFYDDQLGSHIVGAVVTWQLINSPEGAAHWKVDNNKFLKTRPEYEFNPGLWIWDWRQWCGLEHHNFPLELNAVNFRNAFINLWNWVVNHFFAIPVWSRPCFEIISNTKKGPVSAKPQS